MSRVKYQIIKTKCELHPYLQHLIDKELVASWYQEEGIATIYYIFGRYGTNKTKLKKILLDHIKSLRKK